MSGGRRAETLMPTMAAPRSDQTRISRTAGHLVFGVDDRIASTVFGTVTTMATLAAYGRAFPDRPWELVLLVASTVAIFWVAHLYAHGLSESISERRPLRADTLRRLAHRELGVLLAAVPPTAALALGAVGLITERASIWLALATGLVALAVQGTRYARIERLGVVGTFAAVAANVGLGLLVVALKVAILH
jgi:hypothetical protein